MNKYLTIILIFYCQSIHSQLKVSFREDCLEHNSLVFSDALMHVCGEDSIATWLKKEVIIVAAIMFNHHGYASKLSIVRCRNFNLSKAQKHKIETLTLRYLTKNHSSFVICADYVPEEQITDSILQYHNQRLMKLLRKKKKLRPYIGVDFNGASVLPKFDNYLEKEAQLQ